MTDQSDDLPSESAPPERSESKKRRKKRPDGGARTFARPELNERGQDRPQFLLNFPEDPALEQLIHAFEHGNYDVVRREAPLLAERTGNVEVRDAALELRRRVDPDPLLKYLLGISIALLVFLTIYTYAVR